MRILLLNVPHPSIGSSISDHLPPLGLLSVGGPLLDDGHEVQLIDGELWPRSEEAMLEQAAAFAPEAVLFGHCGSTTAHPVIAAMSRRLRARLPKAVIIYGGVFPTYHWREILAEEPQIDVVVRGEGEETCRRVVACLATGRKLAEVPGIAWRENDEVRVTPAAPIIPDLDVYRIGWELIDHRRYTYWGGRRAVGVQFSRGCPHRCTFCGQRLFWARWRHRDPQRLATELGRLHREEGVEVINFADENPTASRRAWEQFLRALIAEDVPLRLVGSTRADSIVRDADILHLYKQAGFERILLGTENTDEATLRRIDKGSSTANDRQAVRLLQQHGILALVTYVVGFEEETDRSYWRALRQLLSLDADQVSVVYATPHRWTEFFHQSAHRRVIQLDRRWWDYKHQVLETRHVPAWRVLLWVKLIEAVLQLRPKALWRTWANPDPRLRAAMRWYGSLGRSVWPSEIRNYLFREHRTLRGPTVAEFWGPDTAEQRAGLEATVSSCGHQTALTDRCQG